MMILFICSRKETPWMDCICWLHEDVSLYMTLVEKTEVNFHRKAHCEGPTVTEPPHATMTEHPSEPHVTTERTTIPPYVDHYSTTPRSTPGPHTTPQPTTGRPRTTIPPFSFFDPYSTTPRSTPGPHTTPQPTTGRPRTTIPPFFDPYSTTPRSTQEPQTHTPITEPDYELIMKIITFVEEIFKTFDCLFPPDEESPITTFLLSISMPTDFTHYPTLALVDTIVQKLMFMEHAHPDDFMHEIYSSGIDQVNSENWGPSQ